MPMMRALQVVLGISVFGAVFSGVLTYREVFGATAAACPAPGAPGTVLGYTACVYGFFMYLAIAATAAAGLRAGHRDVGLDMAPTPNS
jgi:hypothetical protein